TQRVDTTPAGKDWIAGKSAGWKVYNTSETDTMYRFLQALAFRCRTMPHRMRVHNQREWRREPGTVQVTNYPPIISFTINHNPAAGRLKDTVTNVKNGQGFTVNINADDTAHPSLHLIRSSMKLSVRADLSEPS
ncbi:hypothetical protein EV424DRAFT_1434088, partial [Suillus variegatus]